MARAGVDSVALSSHYASRTLPAPARSWSRRRSDGHQDRRRDRARLEPVGRPGSWKVIQWAVVRARRRGGARGRRRVHGGALLLGPLKFRWTTCVRLDHLRALGPPGSRNTVVQRNASGPTARKWSKRAGRVTTCETPSHHARRSVGRSRCGTPEPPRRPNRPAPGSRRPERAGPPPTTGPPIPPPSRGRRAPVSRTGGPPRRRGPRGNRHHTKRRTRDRPATAPFRPGGAGRLKEKALRVGVGVRPPGGERRSSRPSGECLDPGPTPRGRKKIEPAPGGGARRHPTAHPYWSEPSLDTRIMMNSTNAQIPFAAMTSQAKMYAPPKPAA